MNRRVLDHAFAAEALNGVVPVPYGAEPAFHGDIVT
jgi:hypothetical protein